MLIVHLQTKLKPGSRGNLLIILASVVRTMYIYFLLTKQVNDVATPNGLK